MQVNNTRLELTANEMSIYNNALSLPFLASLAILRGELDEQILAPLQAGAQTLFVVLASCVGGFAVSVTAFQVGPRSACDTSLCDQDFSSRETFSRIHRHNRFCRRRHLSRSTTSRKYRRSSSLPSFSAARCPSSVLQVICLGHSAQNTPNHAGSHSARETKHARHRGPTL